MRVKTTLVGAGPSPALLIPGNDLCGTFYRPLADCLARQGSAVRLCTLPGTDDVPPLPHPGWSALVEALLEVDPAPQVVIGHSMGGLLALLLAARCPSVRALVLLEPTLLRHQFLARHVARDYLARVVRAESHAFTNWNGSQRRIGTLDTFPEEQIRLHEQLRASRHRPTAEALFATLPDLYPLPFHEISAPVLYVRGARSGWRSHLMMACTRRVLPGEICTLAGAGHWLANEDDPALAGLISPFLRDHASSTPR